MRPLSKLLNITILDKEATEFLTNEILKVLNSSEPSIQKVIYQSTVISSLKTNQFKGAKNNAIFWLSIEKYLSQKIQNYICNDDGLKHTTFYILYD